MDGLQCFVLAHLDVVGEYHRDGLAIRAGNFIIYY